MTETPDPQRFADMGRPRRVWAVAAIHGEADRLKALHGALRAAVVPGDRIIYLGNMLGRGAQVRATVDELLAFRREVIAQPGMLADDVVYLRGMQEEMWQKLLQLQMAPNPSEVLNWMLAQGLDATLAAYGADPREGLIAVRGGAMAITRWTMGLRAAQRAAAGHDALITALRRAAFTRSDPGANPGADPRGGLLFVNAGLDPTRPLFDQGDRFWWTSGRAFQRISAPYGGFARLVRGYDPTHGGLQVGPTVVTLDGGCGFGGPLACGLFDSNGEVVEILEA